MGGVTLDVAYFIGILHSDACFSIFHDKKRNRKNIRLKLYIGKKSIPMAIKFRYILLNSFNRNLIIHKKPHKEIYYIQTSVNKLWNIFSKWENGNIPIEIKIEPSLFGSYLAGLIDGDGHVHQKHNKDRLLPQLLIEISGPERLLEVKNIIETFTTSKVNFRKRKNQQCVETYFYVTFKNTFFLEKFVLPHLSLIYKKELLDNHIQKIKFRKLEHNFQQRINKGDLNLGD